MFYLTTKVADKYARIMKSFLKLLAIIVCFCVMMSLVACARDTYANAEPTEAPTSATTPAATQDPTRAPTQAATQAPTQTATAPATEPEVVVTTPVENAPVDATAPTEEPAVAPTEPTQAPTTVPTEAPTQAPTQKPTEAPAKSTYPLTYSDATCSITIDKEWYENAWCYVAHIQFTDYDRFGTSCANGAYRNGYETTSHAANRLGAIFAVNGCYSSPDLGYGVARSGKLWNDLRCIAPAVYSSNTGIFASPYSIDVSKEMLSTVVADGRVTDTFWFGPAILSNGEVVENTSTERAQRTFIGTNGNAGDMWIVVSDGRYNDGESAGLTYTQCAKLLKSKGCTFGIPLDGGGSSTMYFNGQVLNAAKGNERAVVDFVYVSLTRPKSRASSPLGARLSIR